MLSRFKEPNDNRRLWNSKDWSAELIRILVTKGYMPPSGQIAIEIDTIAEPLFEEAMQHAAEIGVV